MLKPETISDSPSAKSKGARLVSAKLVMNQQEAKGSIIKTSGRPWLVLTQVKLKLWSKNKGDRRKRAILTSYEIVWATARKAPIKAYLELEAQPETKVA